jgi:putative ABC transport system permease protein
MIAGLAMIVAGMALIRFAPLRVGLGIQFAYAVLILFGMVLLLPKLTQWIARLLRPLMDRLFGSEGVLAVDTMIQSPRRTSATVGALMVGLMFVFATAAYVHSYQRTVADWMDRVVNCDLFVAASDQARSRTYHFSEELSQKIAALPGVKRIENVRFMFPAYADDSIALIALDMDGWFARVRDVVEGADEAEARERVVKGEGVLVARNFHARYHLGVGDRLKLATPTGPFDLPIAGIIEDYTSEKGAIFMDRGLYKKYWNDPSVDMIEINLHPGVDRAAVKSEVQRLVKGEHRAFVYTNQEYKQWIMDLINGFFAMSYMQMAVSIIIAALGIVNALMISVAERKRELGVLRAIGGLRGQIRKMILLEAAAIAIVGVTVGAIAGAMNTYFIVRTMAMMVGGYVIPFEFSPVLVFTAMPIALVIALVAAWWPARKAVNLTVIEAIGYE